MAIPFKKVMKGNPREPLAPSMYYPLLVTLGQSLDEEDMAFLIKEASSLSKGDILSVLNNFIEIARRALYDGHSVNIRNFGVFSLSAHSEGSQTEEECTAKKIKSVKINFRPSSSVRPDMATTRAGERLKFVEVEAYRKGTPGGNPGTDPGDENDEDPTA